MSEVPADISAGLSNLRSKLDRYLLNGSQSRCAHPDEKVIADILQRDNLPTVVSWCGICGAYWVHAEGDWSRPDWRRPRPTW